MSLERRLIFFPRRIVGSSVIKGAGMVTEDPTAKSGTVVKNMDFIYALNVANFLAIWLKKMRECLRGQENTTNLEKKSGFSNRLRKLKRDMSITPKNTIDIHYRNRKTKYERLFIASDIFQFFGNSPHTTLQVIKRISTMEENKP